VNFKLIEKPNEITEACQHLSASPVIGYDVETTDLDPMLGRLRLVQLSDGKTTYILDLDPFNKKGSTRTAPELQPLRDLLTGPITKVIHNAKFDCKWTSYCLGVEITNLFCTMLNSQILACGKSDRAHNLAAAAYHFLGIVVDKTEQTSDWSAARLERSQLEYAAKDVLILPALYDAQVGRLTELDLLEVSRLENDAVPAVVDMELTGIYLNDQVWRDYLVTVEAEHKRLADVLQRELVDPNGPLHLFDRADINLGSTQQVHNALTSMGIPVPDSTEAWRLEPLVAEYPVIGTLLEYRGVDKILTSFGESILKMVHPVTGRLHPDFRQLGALTTGRFSASNPNCFPPDVEILTEDSGWVRFDELKKASKVAAFDQDSRQIQFEAPQSWIQQRFSGNLYHVKGKEQVNFIATPDHDVLLETRRSGTWKKFPAEAVPPDHKIFQAATVKKSGKSLNEWEVSLYCAVQADASVSSGGAVDIKFSRPRKIERFRKTLQKLGIPYTETVKKYPSAKHKDQTRFYIAARDLPPYLEKEFSWSLLDYDSATLERFAKEVFLWDGESARSSAYTSRLKQNCDVVQAALTLTGRRANVRSRQVGGRQYWDVYASNRAHSMTTNLSTTPVPYVGDVYCVSVPSGNIVTRYQGVVTIIGNCQQWPAFAEARAAIQAAPGKRLVIADYSQIELRILADRCQDPTFVEAFRTGRDFHLQTAAQVNNIPMEEVTDEQRSFAKRLNFGIVYGVTPYKFSIMTGTTKEEAEDTMAKYFDQLPGLGRYVRDSGRVSVCKRECRTASGRVLHLHFDEKRQGSVNSAMRNGVNMPIQGTSADILKRALKLIHDSNKGTSAHLVNIVHDEVLLECDEHEAEQTARRLEDMMIAAGKEYVKTIDIKVDAVVAKEWRKK